MNRRPDIAATGDAGQFLETPAAQSSATGTAPRWSPWIAQLCARDAVRETEIDEQAKTTGTYVNPITFFRALEREAGDNAILVADGGDFVATASYVMHPRAPLT